MASIEERAAQIMEHLCSHSAHGYSQPNRAGVGTGGGKGETLTLSDGTRVQVSTGDRDCSSAVIECFAAQGVDCGGATYTGNMRSRMVASGNFEALPASTWRSPRRGDVLLTERNGHTALALGGGRLGEFLRSERHSTHGSLGDQDGGESIVRALYDDGWDCVLRYRGPEPAGTTTTTTTQDGDEMYCIIQPNGANVLMYFDGRSFHDLTHPDDVTALNMVYKATHGGASIPTIKLGKSGEPWASRLHQALEGGCPHKLVPNLDAFKPRTPREE